MVALRIYRVGSFALGVRERLGMNFQGDDQFSVIMLAPQGFVVLNRSANPIAVPSWLKFVALMPKSMRIGTGFQ